jgi:hypothetical protein
MHSADLVLLLLLVSAFEFLPEPVAVDIMTLWFVGFEITLMITFGPMEI